MNDNNSRWGKNRTKVYIIFGILFIIGFLYNLFFQF